MIKAEKIAVLGAKGEVKNVERLLEKIKEFSTENKVSVQILNAEATFKDQIWSATLHAIRAFETKRNLSNSVEIEILLYASGERQIKNAIKKIGIKKGTKKLALVVLGKCNLNRLLSTLNLERDDSVLDWHPRILRRFGVGKKESQTVDPKKLKDLILERIALSDLER